MKSLNIIMILLVISMAIMAQTNYYYTNEISYKKLSNGVVVSEQEFDKKSIIRIQGSYVTDKDIVFDIDLGDIKQSPVVFNYIDENVQDGMIISYWMSSKDVWLQIIRSNKSTTMSLITFDKYNEIDRVLTFYNIKL